MGLGDMKKATFWMMVTTSAFWILWDVFAAALSGNSATESVILLKLGHDHPIIPLAVGVLLGHFWWSQKAEALQHTSYTNGYSKGWANACQYAVQNVVHYAEKAQAEKTQAQQGTCNKGGCCKGGPVS